MTRELSFVCGRQGSGLRENGGEWSRVSFMRASVPVNTVDCVDAAKFSDPVRNGPPQLGRASGNGMNNSSVAVVCASHNAQND